MPQRVNASSSARALNSELRLDHGLSKELEIPSSEFAYVSSTEYIVEGYREIVVKPLNAA